MTAKTLVGGYSSYTTADEVAASSTVEPPASASVASVLITAASAATVYNTIDQTFDNGC